MSTETNNNESTASTRRLSAGAGIAVTGIWLSCVILTIFMINFVTEIFANHVIHLLADDHFVIRFLIIAMHVIVAIWPLHVAYFMTRYMTNDNA